MVTTITIILLIISIIINRSITKQVLLNHENDMVLLEGKLDALKDMDVSRGRMVHNLSRDLESLKSELNTLRSNPTNLDDKCEPRFKSIESSVNNLYADLDRTIGSIDQVQEKIAEINVTLENIVNRLNNE